MDDKLYYANRVTIASSTYGFYFKFETRVPKFDEASKVEGEKSFDELEILMSA